MMNWRSRPLALFLPIAFLLLPQPEGVWARGRGHGYGHHHDHHHPSPHHFLGFGHLYGYTPCGRQKGRGQERSEIDRNPKEERSMPQFIEVATTDELAGLHRPHTQAPIRAFRQCAVRRVAGSGSLTAPDAPGSWGVMKRRVNLIPSFRLDAFLDGVDGGRVHLSARGPPGTVAGLLLGGREGEQ